MNVANFDFSGLTPRQQEVLAFQGWTTSMAGMVPQPSKRTVQKLLDRGLVIEHIVQRGCFTYREYEVPLAVHIAWCFSYSDKAA